MKCDTELFLWCLNNNARKKKTMKLGIDVCVKFKPSIIWSCRCPRGMQGLWWLKPRCSQIWSLFVIWSTVINIFAFLTIYTECRLTSMYLKKKSMIFFCPIGKKMFNSSMPYLYLCNSISWFKLPCLLEGIKSQRNKETEWNTQPLRSPLLFQNKSQKPWQP